VDRKLPSRDCEALAVMASSWDPIRGVGTQPLLDLRNASSLATRKSVTLVARCPYRMCHGMLELNPDFRGGADGRAELLLRGRRWQRVKLNLTPRGSRRVARHRRLALWLFLDDEVAAPVVLTRVGR
jgi:hypothetical protein